MIIVPWSWPKPQKWWQRLGKRILMSQTNSLPPLVIRQLPLLSLCSWQDHIIPNDDSFPLVNGSKKTDFTRTDTCLWSHLLAPAVPFQSLILWGSRRNIGPESQLYSVLWKLALDSRLWWKIKRQESRALQIWHPVLLGFWVSEKQLALKFWKVVVESRPLGFLRPRRRI